MARGPDSSLPASFSQVLFSQVIDNVAAHYTVCTGMRRAWPKRAPRKKRYVASVVAVLALLYLIRRRGARHVANQVTQTETQEPTRYLFSTPRSGGFNNQLITIYEAIRCAQIIKRTLILPLIYENVRADTTSKGFGPYPFEDYFDVDALLDAAPVITPKSLFAPEHPQIDPCGGEVLFATSRHFYAHEKRIPRLLKQQYSKPPYNLTAVFVKDLAKESGRKTRETAACIDDSACDAGIFFRDDEFGEYSDYDSEGQGYNIRTHERLKRIRSAFKPNEDVKLIANDVLAHIGGHFNAMHIRRGDFADKCEELPDICHQYGEEALFQSSEGLRKKLNQFENPSLPLFVSTTHPEECRELFKDVPDLKIIFMEDVQLRSMLEWTRNRTDIIAYASQLVASRAKEFVGNRFSSFTTTINYMRIIQNPKVKSIFF